MNRKEQTRLKVLSQVDRAELTAVQAAEVLGLSQRQVRRTLAAYRKEGAAALAHGNRGRTPANAIASTVRQQVAALAQSSSYLGCNHQHFTELLGRREQIHLSRPTVRRILLEAGLRSPRRRRPPQHRSRRERMPQAGMLLQLDASYHDWLEGRGPRLSLVGAIDDATGRPWALFRENEDAHGYFLLLQHIVATQGIPVAVYRDRHSIFQVNQQQSWTPAEELAGQQDPTQFGRLLAELGITSIAAHSPQAKGRIERLWGTLQDRLVIELRLAGATTLGEAQRVLEDFLPRFTDDFAVPAAQPGSAYRVWPATADPATHFCFKYGRTAGADNVVRFGQHRLQIAPRPERASYARVRVEVHERLDGSLAVYHQEQQLAYQPAPMEAPILRARKRRAVEDSTGREEIMLTGVDLGAGRAAAVATAPKDRRAAPKSTPRPDHPWRRYPVTKSRENYKPATVAQP